ncbi:MAG: tetratricopeptide repeat protein [Spirochaetota bacterium]
MLSLNILIPVITIIGVSIVIFLIIFTRKKTSDSNRGSKLKGKDRNAIVKEANKRLAQNPKDPEALLALADLYFRENSFEKAMKTFALLIDLCSTNPELNELDITVKYALSALKLKNYDEAYKSLLIARTLKQDVFEVNYNLGYLEYLKKNFEKSAGFLQMAVKAQPDHVPSMRFLGHSLFKIKRYKDAVFYLSKTLDVEPDDKESLFALAHCYYELGQNEQAIKIFTHLRTDPQVGPTAALFAGTIHLNNKQQNKAIMDFEIGLRHEQIKPDTAVEMRYRLATAYIQQQDIGRAVKLLNEIQDVVPAYKDVPQKLKTYQELSSNQNLQTYLISPPSEFTALCRKIAESYYPKAKVKITDISLHKSEYADILTEVTTNEWEDIILFRFIRTTGPVGELMVRDMYTRIKEVKAGRGFCLSAGDFSDEARQFVEARLIDLIDKKELMKKLSSLVR